MWHRNDVLFNGQFCIFTHNFGYNYATKMVGCSLELYWSRQFGAAIEIQYFETWAGEIRAQTPLLGVILP